MSKHGWNEMIKRKLGFFPKQLVVPTLLLAVVAVVVAVSSLYTLRRTAAHTEQLLTASANEQAKALYATLDGQYKVLDIFAATIARGRDGSEGIRRNLALACEDADFDAMLCAAPDGAAIRNDGMVTDLSKRAYFKKAMSGERAIERLDDENQPPRIVLAVPIKRGGTVVGAVVGRFNESTLRRLIIPEIFGGEAYSFVCDEDGNFQIGSDSPNLKLKGRNLFAVLTETAKRFNVQPPNDAIRSDMREHRTRLLDYITTDGGKRYFVYVPLGIATSSGRECYLFNVLPEYIVSREVRQVTTTNSIFAMIIMLCAMAVYSFVVSRERRTSKRLAEDAEKLRTSEEEFRIAALAAGRGVGRYDIRSGQYRRIGVISSLFGIGHDEVIEGAPQSFVDKGAISPESVRDFLEFYEKIIRGEKNPCASLALRTGDGSLRWFRADATVVFDGDGRPANAVISYSDITEQRERDAVYARWTRSMEDRDPKDFTLFQCNLSKGASFDRAQGELLRIQFSPDIATFNGRTLEYARLYVCHDDFDAYTAMMNSDSLLAGYFRGRRALSMVYREIVSDTEYRWLRVSLEISENAESHDVEAFMLYENVDESKRAEEAMRIQAETDSLTGVLNRAAFIARFGALMSAEPFAVHALLMVDVDGFKVINDVFGHDGGDKALVETAVSLRGSLRGGDLLGRFGGDEFLIGLRNIRDKEDAEGIAKRMCAEARRALSFDMQISLSIGIALSPEDGTDFDSLYSKADAALYSVKGSGKDGYAFFSEDLRESVQLRHIEPEDETCGEGAPAKPRMLIVDDDEMALDMFTGLFGDDYTVVTANSGKSALIRLRHYGSQLAVILLDVFMPDIDGFDVLKQIRSRQEMKFIPVVVVSSADDPESSLMAVKLGAADFVNKPVDPDAIRLRVKTAITHAADARAQHAQDTVSALSAGDEGYRTLFDDMGTCVIEYDITSGVYSYDPAITGSIAGRYDGRGLWQILLADMAARTEDVKAMQELAQDVAGDMNRRSGSKEVLLKTPSNMWHWFLFNVFKKERGLRRAEKLYLTFKDINDKTLEDEKLRFQAEHDKLTGLFSRDAFIERLAKTVRDGEPGSWALFVGDVDKFKFINERFGTAEGDRLLRYIAEKLSFYMEKDGGLCGRLGNDNFGFLLPNVPEIAERVETILQHCCDDYPGRETRIQCSVGMYVVDYPEIPVESMLDRAMLAKGTIKAVYDTALAQYDDSMLNALRAEREIEDMMEEALASGQFAVYMQPQYNHASGMICGAEALVRWIHPQKGVISPAGFVPVFEKNGFIAKLDEFVWNRTAELMRGWIAEGRSVVPVSVNISRRDLEDPELCARLLDIVRRNELPIELFRLEITESLFVDDTELLISVIGGLRGAGFIVEMDDFGSGYSSLNTLKDVPVDIIKLDMRFFSGAGDSGRGGVITGAVIRMARWLDMQVIAEGVEKSEQADFLLGVGCRTIQGYLYARPMPADDFAKLAEAGTDTDTHSGAVDAKFEPEDLWAVASASSRFFSLAIGMALIIEYHGGEVQVLRVSQQFAETIGVDYDWERSSGGFTGMCGCDASAALAAVESAISTGKAARFTARRDAEGAKPRVCTLRLIAKSDDRAMLLCMIDD